MVGGQLCGSGWTQFWRHMFGMDDKCSDDTCSAHQQLQPSLVLGLGVGVQPLHVLQEAVVLLLCVRGAKEMMQPLSDLPASHLFGCAVTVLQEAVALLVCGAKEMIRGDWRTAVPHLNGAALPKR